MTLFFFFQRKKEATQIHFLSTNWQISIRIKQNETYENNTKNRSEFSNFPRDLNLKLKKKISEKQRKETSEIRNTNQVIVGISVQKLNNFMRVRKENTNTKSYIGQRFSNAMRWTDFEIGTNTTQSNKTDSDGHPSYNFTKTPLEISPLSRINCACRENTEKRKKYNELWIRSDLQLSLSLQVILSIIL